MKKSVKDIQIAVIASQYRPEVTEKLIANCLTTLKKKGIHNIEVFRVPGSLEIPLVAKKLAKKNKFDAMIAFGAVYKGETYHFQQVANECIRGCMNVSYEYEIPLVFEVLCVYDPKDAIKRAFGKEDNRGIEGALTALKMIKLIRKL